MTTICKDPVLEMLLLAHIEPAMQKLLKNNREVDGGLRKIRRFETYGNTMPFKYLLEVEYTTKRGFDNYYWFKIRTDGTVIT